MNKFMLAIAMTVLLAATVFAQTINGTISGTVTDTQGAIVPGATITVTNASNGLSRTSVTDNEGSFRISGLAVGTYNVKVEKTGFASKINNDVEVNVGSDVSLKFSLDTGSVTATVDITSTGEVLETTQSQVTKNVSERQILELPGRNSLNGLALLNPGVLPSQNGRPGSGFAVNGNRTRSNNFTIDGANNNDQSLSTPRQGLPPEAIQQFQIITNTFAAEFGRNAGSYVNQITRSGTNKFSGTGFYTWAGNGLDSLTTGQQRSFNANVATLGKDAALRNARSVSVDNTYGATFGGPIKKNHTFFFTSLDFNDFRTTVSSATRAAFSPLARTRLQLAGRTIVPQALNYLLTNFPAANDPTSLGSVTLTGTSAITCPASDLNCNVLPIEIFNRGRTAGIPYGTDFNRWLIKINTKLTDNDQLSFRYLVDKSVDPGAPASLAGQEVGSTLRNDSFTINDAYLISPKWLNEARFTYSRREQSFPERLGVSFTVAGLNGGLNLGNANFPQSRKDDVYEITDNISFSPSNHSLKFGYNLLIYKLNSFFAPNFRGTVSYPGIVNFLQDTSASFSQYAGDGRTDATTYENSVFAQDNWKVSSDLTLNLGVRYEYITAPFGFFSNAKPDVNNIAPRLGFAWNPKNILDGKAVVRAGFAISYDQVFQNILLNNSRNFPRGVNVAQTNINGALPYINLPTPPTPANFTGNPLLLPTRLFAPNERVRQPMSKQWTLGVQYQFLNDYVFKADYIGTLGSGLVREVEQNFGFTTASGGTGLRLDPTRGSILVGQGIANSSYHAGQFTLEKQYSDLKVLGKNFGGVLFNANYTFSAFISESDDVLGGQANRTLPSDPRNPKLDKARSGFDSPHRAVISFVWATPKFSDNAFVSRLLNDWQISAVGTYSTGTPFSVLNANNALGILPGQISTVELSQRVSVNPSGTRGTFSVPCVVGSAGCTTVGPGLGQTNPGAFYIVNAANSGILGTLGANTERTGNTQNWNIAAVKNVRTFGDTQRLQFRAEIFNLFNHRNFTVIPVNTIGNTVNAATFLNLGQTNVGGRGFTFGARYFF
jgi:outer membrane receptor protein involved in Fe transport